MPTWLVHGFRWPRRAIRIHIILQNLEDCAAEWLMAPATTAELTSNFKSIYSDQMVHLPSLRFIEQYDPEDETVKDQPWAYVCDQVHEIKLGADVDEVRGVGVQSGAWEALVELRDKIAPGEKVGWFVVVNGDVERWAPRSDEEDDQGQEKNVVSKQAKIEEVQPSAASRRSSVGRDTVEIDGEAKQKGLKKWLGKVRRAKSSKDLKNEMVTRGSPASPPLPKSSHYNATLNGKGSMSAGTT